MTRARGERSGGLEAAHVGDSARLIDDPARVVPPGRPELLAGDMVRVRAEYGIEKMAGAYVDTYAEVTGGREVTL